MADIRSYVDMFEIENKHLFLYLISEMDNEYLQTRYKERPKVSAESKSTATMTGNKF
jgi:hypothetical protein